MKAPTLSLDQKLAILFEEYRALYPLVSLRLTSLDNRAALAWGALAVFTASFQEVGRIGQLVLLLGSPLLISWLLRTTIAHARSVQDVLRRLDQVERRINEAAGEELLAFQSRHPSREIVGGRTGWEIVQTVLITGIVLLAVCGFMLVESFDVSTIALWSYDGYLIVAALYLCQQVLAFRSYRYQKR